MAKAAPAEQLKLLELQGLDAKLKSLAGRRPVLETDPRITDLEAALCVANGELGAAKVAVHDAEAELKRAEADVEQVATRIERDESPAQQRHRPVQGSGGAAKRHRVAEQTPLRP